MIVGFICVAAATYMAGWQVELLVGASVGFSLLAAVRSAMLAYVDREKSERTEFTFICNLDKRSMPCAI